MTEQKRAGLTELQRLDDAIAALGDRIEELEQRVEDVGEPVRSLTEEVETTRGRLQEMRVEERRRELAGEEKRARQKRLEERLNVVRNVREESAVTAELDMVRRAREADEQEALSLLDQVRRLEDRFEEQGAALEAARAELDPRRQELESEMEAAREEASRLKSERDAFAAGLPERELRVYQAIRSGGRRRALAPLTEDGACGHCFNMVPLQVQNEIRHHGADLVRCEACGVILSVPDSLDAESAGT
ncbi:MAG: C4-type zinc ribbon domain-containing protein [Longimicrobiales bacterium]|nr:C4-type zinc ribbon domain-containing protein [Longimicrobiales bacterium]